MKKYPKIIYANRVNLAGLYSKVPLKLTRQKGHSFYSDSEGDFVLAVSQIGDFSTDGQTTFSSPNLKEVELWTRGATAVMRQLFNWSKYAGDQ